MAINPLVTKLARKRTAGQLPPGLQGRPLPPGLARLQSSGGGPFKAGGPFAGATAPAAPAAPPVTTPQQPAAPVLPTQAAPQAQANVPPTVPATAAPGEVEAIRRRRGRY